MKIVFPTDGSEASIVALRHLAARIDWFSERPKVALIHVHLHLPYARAAAWVGKEAAHRYYEEESSAALASASATLDQDGIAYERVQRIGEPASEIVKFCGEWRADLIAMGRHGHSAMMTLLMGSVTQKVIATSPVPVLIVQ